MGKLGRVRPQDAIRIVIKLKHDSACARNAIATLHKSPNSRLTAQAVQADVDSVDGSNMTDLDSVDGIRKAKQMAVPHTCQRHSSFHVPMSKNTVKNTVLMRRTPLTMLQAFFYLFLPVTTVLREQLQPVPFDLDRNSCFSAFLIP